MLKRSLKRYDEYLQLLELYARASKIKIVYNNKDGDGSYIPTRNKIRIDPDLSPTREVAVLLHELGHSMDDSILDKKHEVKVAQAYYAVYHGRPGKVQRALVMATEQRAWMYGRAIAKKLKIPLGKWYDIVQNECLKSYEK